MKALTKFFAVILVLAVIAAAVGFAMEGFDFKTFAKAAKIVTDNDFEFVEQTQSGGFSSLKIDVLSKDITLSDSTDENFYISYYISEDYAAFDYSAENGEISLIQQPKAFSISMLALSFSINKAADVTVKIPSSFGGKLDLKTTSGNVFVKTSNSLETALLKTSSGDVALENAVVSGAVSLQTASGRVSSKNVSAGGELKVETTSGDIAVSDSQADTLNTRATSGRIEIKKLTAAKTVKAVTASGDITISDSQADSLDANATSGRIEIKNLTADKTVKAVTASGDIKLTAVTAKGLDARATSGSITVTVNGLQSAYRIDINATSGTTRVAGVKVKNGVINDNHSLVPLKAHTTSGDIKIDFLG